MSATARHNTHTSTVLSYGRQCIDETDVAAVVDALRGEYLTTGPHVAAFEDALSTRVGGVPVVAMSSGTAALHAAYAAAGLGPGTELLTTPLTFAATATAAAHLGARVRFADVDEATLTLDPAAAEAAINSNTRVITAVDYAGHPADYPALHAIARANDCLLVDDAAHALGSVLHGTPIGAHADLTTFSFHPVKTITTGEGGAVAVNRKELLTAVQTFRNHGLVRERDRFHHPEEGGWHQEVHTLGLNYRMPDILAALGRSQLDKLGQFVTRRSALVDRYHQLLRNIEGLRLPHIAAGAQPAWHLFPVRILDGRRREVFDRMRAAGIGVQVHYLPVYRHPVFAELQLQGSCPVAEQAYSQLLSLPLHPQMTERDQDRVVHELVAILGN